MKGLICLFLYIGFLFSVFGEEPTPSPALTLIEKDADEPLLVGYGYIQVWDMLNKKKEIADTDLYKLEAFMRLKDGRDQFSYYILEEVNWGDSFKSFLIYEDYDSESAIWLANYDEDYNLIDYLEIYYDNAEGAWTTTSKIYRKQHLIELTQYDAYGMPETSIKRFEITSNGKIQK